MAGMIGTIARMIRAGTMTPAEIAKSAGITRAQLADRLALMERQGYLARVGGGAPGTECSCGHCCSCGKRDGAPGPVLYMLTQKGERLAGLAGVRSDVAPRFSE